MRRCLVLFLMCLLPLQISWAAVADYCEHEDGKAVQHFGHHQDEHQALPDLPDSDKQPGKSELAHDHCHLSGFLGVLNESVVRATAALAHRSPQRDEPIHPSFALHRPERPKWQVPA